MLSLKHFRWIVVSLILLLIISPLTGMVGETESENDYFFSVPEEIVEVWINTDGSVDIKYWITFKIKPGGDPIDIVDIGFPNKHYDLDSVTVDVNGTPVTDIRVSEVIDIGVEIHLHESTITNAGILHVEGNQPYMIFEDSEDDEMASVVFGNTFWSYQYAKDMTNLTTRIIFPSTVYEVTPTKYHFNHKYDRFYYLENGRKVFEWNEPDAWPSQQYKYGVSFPKSGVEWYTEVPLTAEEVFMGFISSIIIVGIILAVILIPTVNYIRRRQRLMDYIPPFVSVPTAGPRTDLRREEVAIVLEKPANVTISMIILTLIQKGLLQKLSPENSNLQPVKGSKKHLRKYERQVLTSILPDFSIDEGDLVKAVTSLVKFTQRRIRGYSYKKTVEYYEKLIQDSIATIKSESDPQNVPTEAWFWAILDEEFLPDFEMEIRKQEYYDEYYDYYPWYYHYGYHHWHRIPRGRSFTQRVTKVSHPVPRGSSGRSRGGGGCACACAGCACACAGGGR
ncbi:MAG: hypothetical protein ACFFAE_05435 [Candidatus Hodarchaeota archaeon]